MNVRLKIYPHLLQVSVVSQLKILPLYKTISRLAKGIFDILTLQPLTCYKTNIWYMSAEVYQPSNSALDYAVYGARTDCQDEAQFPSVNTCFNTESDGVSAYFMTFFYTTPT